MATLLVKGVAALGVVAVGALTLLSLRPASVPTSPAASATEPRYAHLIDAICSGTGIQPQHIEAVLRLFSGSEFSRSDAANFPAERAWSFLDNGTRLTAAYNSRLIDGQALRDCALGFGEGSHASAARVIENSYRLRRVIDERQGTQRVSGYHGDLLELPDAMITIQSMATESGVHLVTVTQGVRLPR